MQSSSYDPLLKIWYEPDDTFEGLYVPENPSVDDLEWAKGVLTYPFDEFPLVDGMAPALAVVFERVMMPLLADAPRPIYVFDAPQQRSGKTLLAQSLCAIVTGSTVAGADWSSTSAEEQGKQLVTYLKNGDEIHLLDNLTGVIASDALARLVTSPFYQARMLGGNETGKFKNVATWLLTLNGATFSQDIAMRAVLVRLDAGANPGKRGMVKRWKIDRLVQWCVDYRQAYVQAALIVARGWVRAGCPADARLTGMRGGFETWMHVIGGVLNWIGIGDLKPALTAAEGRKEGLEEDETLLDTWRSTYGAMIMTPQDLVQLAKELGLYENVIARSGRDAGTWAARRFSKEVLERLRVQGIVERTGHRGRYWKLL